MKPHAQTQENSNCRAK